MGFEGLSQPRHSGVAVRGNQRQKATALSSRQDLPAIGIAARSWADCQSFPHLSLASDQKGPPYSDSTVGGSASRHGQTHQLGSMKISSQLANNFDYCSTETFSEYGPFYFYVQEALFHLLRLPITYDSGRLVTLVYWTISELLGDAFVYKISRNIVLGSAATLACFSLARVLANEPGHPQQL